MNLANYRLPRATRGSLTFVFAILLGWTVPCQAANSPSARFLLESWRGEVGQFSKEVKSYRLDAACDNWHLNLYTSAAAAAKGPVLSKDPPSTWSSTESGDKYLWTLTSYTTSLKISSDGANWCYFLQYPGSEPQYSTGYLPATMGGTSIKDPLLNNQMAYPFDLLLFFNDPMHSSSGASFVDLLEANATTMAVVGQDSINGALCYHVRVIIPDKKRAERQGYLSNLPLDIWFGVYGNRVAPVQLINYYGPSAFRNVRMTVTFSGWHDIGGNLYPNGYSMIGQDRGRDAPNKWTEIARKNVMLSVTGVNSNIPDTEFTVQEPETGDVTVNGKTVRRAGNNKSENPHVQKPNSIVLILVIVVILMSVVYMLLRSRRA